MSSKDIERKVDKKLKGTYISEPETWYKKFSKAKKKYKEKLEKRIPQQFKKSQIEKSPNKKILENKNLEKNG